VQWRATKAPILKEILFEHNQRLATQVAHRWAEQCEIEFEDLEQLAKIGLLKAIDGFDPAKGNRFSSYAMPWIKGEILHFLRDRGRLYSVPRKAREVKARVHSLHRQLIKGGGTASLLEVAIAEGVSEESWSWILEATEKRPVGELNEAVHVAAEQPDTETEDLYEALRQALAQIPNPGRQFLLAKVWGGLKIDAIAQIAAQSPEFVAQHIEMSLGQLRSDPHLNELEEG
jgi:RNA polymerase sigma-B factor